MPSAQLPAYLEPDLIAAAVRVEIHAEALRRRALVIGRYSAAMRWDSPAAWIARDRLDELTAALIGWCRRADALAEQLRTQAAIVRAS